MSPFRECLSAKKKRSLRGISKQFCSIRSHFRKSELTWKRSASSQIASTFDAIKQLNKRWERDWNYVLNYTIWKTMFVWRKKPQKFCEMVAGFDVFNFNFFFTPFFHIVFKHCRKNRRTDGDMMTVHWETMPVNDQCFIRFTSKK